MKKYFLLITIFLLIISSNIYINAKKEKNPNIQQAEDLIKDKKFNEALKILLQELPKDEDNEDTIMKMIDKIEKEKQKIIGMIYAVKESIKNGDFEKAEEILNEMGNRGDFDKTISRIIETMQKEKGPLKKINNFNNYIKTAEEYLINYDIKRAFETYRSALDIYRAKVSTVNDPRFRDAFNKFISSERSLINTNIETDVFSNNESLDYDQIINEKKRLDKITSGWKKLERDLLSVDQAFARSSRNTKDNIVFEAFDSITNKYIETIRRSIQKNGNTLLRDLKILAAKERESLAEGNLKSTGTLSKIFDLMDRLEDDSFYKLTVDFKRDFLFERNKKNLISYLEHITTKNEYKLKRQELISFNQFKLANDQYEKYLDQTKSKELIKADRSLKNAKKEAKNTKDELNDLDLYYSYFTDLKYPEFDVYLTSSQKLSNELDDFNDRLLKGTKELGNSMRYADGLLEEADRMYSTSRNYFDRKNYKEAKINFEETKDKYFEVALVMNSDYVNSRIDRINRYLDEIENIFFKINMNRADRNIEKAKTNFYAENYEEAKKNIDDADEIFKKYNQNRDIIEYYQKRILSAIRIQSGSKLTMDDQAYRVITELMRNARNQYNRGNYDKARKYLTQILLEKPYYRQARLLETKLLKETDPKSFLQIYNSYYTKAKAKYDTGNYSDALLEFQQLIEFGKDTKAINRYIYQCKLRLNLIKPVTSEKDKQRARSLIKQAQSDYANGKYKSALDKANQAIRTWEDVPEAGSIRLACMQKLRIERPKLTRNNELKYREAIKAYSENDFDLAYRLTSEILRSQDFEEVRRLNRKAELKR